MTFFYKRVFPIIWFGILLLVMIGPLVAPLFGGSTSPPPVPFMIMPAFMLIVGYLIMRRLIFDLVDEVVDEGDTLLVRNGQQTERIALSDIMNVSYSSMVNPPRVTLRLRSPSIFGERITFCAPVSFIPFSTNATIDEMIERVDAARGAGSAARRPPLASPKNPSDTPGRAR